MKDTVCRAPIGKEELARAAFVERACLSTAWSEDQISDLPPYATYLCAFCGGTLCGIASMYTVAGEGQILNLAVLDEYRRSGIADSLMLSLLSVAREKECELIALEVEDGNVGAIALYQKHGFEITGRRIGFYNGKDALNMEKRL